MTSVGLLLLVRGGRRNLTGAGLTALGIAVATTLALLVVSVHPALDRRAERLGWTGQQLAAVSLYRDLAAVAAVLLAVPALLLVGAAARFIAARRDQRLAALRLAGATPAGVVALTAAETGLAGVVGAAAGTCGYLALLPLTTGVELMGHPWLVEDLFLGWPALAAALVAVPALAAASAVVALRSVRIGPLGVHRRRRRRRPRVVRFVGLGLAWLAFLSAASTMREGGELVPVLFGFGAVIGGVALVGPWVAWAIGAVMGLLARRPSTLLAARRLTDDPAAAWRAISGVALAGLVAGFLFGVLPTIRGAGEVTGPDRVLLDDLLRASSVVSIVALALAGVAGAIAAAASVLDQRPTLARLRLVGTPVSVLQRARAWQSAVPLVTATVVSTGCGAAAGIALLLAFGARPEQLVAPAAGPLALLVVAGLATGLAAAAATRPVLVAATASPLNDR